MESPITSNWVALAFVGVAGVAEHFCQRHAQLALPAVPGPGMWQLLLAFRGGFPPSALQRQNFVDASLGAQSRSALHGAPIPPGGGGEGPGAGGCATTPLVVLAAVGRGAW